MGRLRRSGCCSRGRTDSKRPLLTGKQKSGPVRVRSRVCAMVAWRCSAPARPIGGDVVGPFGMTAVGCRGAALPPADTGHGLGTMLVLGNDVLQQLSVRGGLVRAGWDGHQINGLVGQALRTLPARGPRGLDSISNVTFSPPTRRSKSIDASSESRWKK